MMSEKKRCFKGAIAFFKSLEGAICKNILGNPGLKGYFLFFEKVKYLFSKIIYSRTSKVWYLSSNFVIYDFLFFGLEQ